MATVEPTQWLKSDDWRSLINDDQHASFLEAIASAARDGETVKSVTVIGGVPVIYNLA